MSQVKFITSTANPLIKEIKSLEMRKRRKETGLFVAEGMRTIVEGIELGAELHTLIFSSEVKARADVIKARDYAAQAVEVNDMVLEKISRKENPQSVIGIFKQKLLSLDEVTTDGVWVVLEEVRDPGNLGTIIRTIDSVGAKGVILIGTCCDPYSFESVRATMGSIFLVPIITAVRDDFIAWSKNWSGQIFGTTLQDSIDYREVEYASPLLLIMGNEQAGMTDELRAICTNLIHMPTKGRAASLHLAIATCVMLYMIESRLER